MRSRELELFPNHGRLMSFVVLWQEARCGGDVEGIDVFPGRRRFAAAVAISG
jgi:hypothetical protein